jgi:hypothetical protein
MKSSQKNNVAETSATEGTENTARHGRSVTSVVNRRPVASH